MEEIQDKRREIGNGKYTKNFNEFCFKKKEHRNEEQRELQLEGQVSSRNLLFLR